MTGFQLPNQRDRLIESFGVGAEGDWISLTPPFTWRLGGLAVKNPSFTGGSWSLAEVGDGLAQVVGGDVGAEEGVAGGADVDEAGGAGDEFLVVGEAVQDRCGVDGIGQDEGLADFNLTVGAGQTRPNNGSNKGSRRCLKVGSVLSSRTGCPRSGQRTASW